MTLSPLEHDLLNFGITYLFLLNAFIKSLVLKKSYQKEKLNNEKLTGIDWAALVLILPFSFFVDAIPLLTFFISPYLAIGVMILYLYNTISKSIKKDWDLAREVRFLVSAQVPLIVCFVLLLT